eukprot:sb/3469127/
MLFLSSCLVDSSLHVCKVSSFSSVVVEIRFLSILRFCRSKSNHPSLRYVCYVGRIPAGSILIKQDRNNPCVLLTHSLNFQYGGLHCPASVHGHVNLTAYIQNVVVKNHHCLYSVLHILIKNIIYYILLYLLKVVEIRFLSILRFCRSKSTHPSLRYVCYVGRIPAGSILIKQDRNNPCVLLTHSLNFQYGGLHCPASVHGHVNLTAYIQNVEFSQHNKNISVMDESILSGKNAKCSER